MIGISVLNNGSRPIRDVEVELVASDGHLINGWQVDELPPFTPHFETQEPGPDDYAKQPSAKVFNAVVRITFVDADGKRWLRESTGKSKNSEVAAVANSA